MIGMTHRIWVVVLFVLLLWERTTRHSFIISEIADFTFCDMSNQRKNRETRPAAIPRSGAFTISRRSSVTVSISRSSWDRERITYVFSVASIVAGERVVGCSGRSSWRSVFGCFGWFI